MKKLSFEQGNTNEYSWYVRVVYEYGKYTEDMEWEQPVADDYFFKHNEFEEVQQFFNRKSLPYKSKCMLLYSRNYLENKWKLTSIHDGVIKER